MKISECIRRGAKMGPQKFGEWGDGNGGSCVMGALLLGTGLLRKELLGFQQPPSTEILLSSLFGHEIKRIAECPQCHMIAALAYVLVHLNDDHEWTRERIAGWIEGNIEVPTYTLSQMMEFTQTQIPDKAVSHVR